MPIHLSVHPGGKHLLLANWGDGSVVVRQLEADGALGSVTDVVPREQAAAHMIVTDRSEGAGRANLRAPSPPAQ